MKYDSNISMVSLQIDFTNEKKFVTGLNKLITYIENMEDLVFEFDYEYQDKKDGILIYYKGNFIFGILTGIYESDNNKLSGSYKYFILLRFHTLKSYNYELDNISHNILLRICSYIKSKKMDCKIRDISLSVDIVDKPENLLILVPTATISNDHYLHRKGNNYIDNELMEGVHINTLSEPVNPSTEPLTTHVDTVESNTKSRINLSLQTTYYSGNGIRNIDVENAIEKYILIASNSEQIKCFQSKTSKGATIVKEREFDSLKLQERTINLDFDVITDFFNSIYNPDEKLIHIDDKE